MSKKTFNFILNTTNAISLNNGDKRFNIRLDNLQGKDYKMTANFKSTIFTTAPPIVDRLLVVSTDLGQTSTFTNDLTQTNVSKTIMSLVWLGAMFSNYYQEPPIFIEKIASTSTITVSVRNFLNNIPTVDIQYILVLSFEEI
jgi:hypothetical protein